MATEKYSPSDFNGQIADAQVQLEAALFVLATADDPNDRKRAAREASELTRAIAIGTAVRAYKMLSAEG
jgi:hypothetical protein